MHAATHYRRCRLSNSFLSADRWRRWSRIDKRSPAGRPRELRGRRLFSILVPPAPPPPPPQAAKTRRDGAKIVEQTDEALTAPERAIQRCHGPRLTRIVVVNPCTENRSEQHGEALSADHAARAGRANPGRGQHPLLRAQRQSVECNRERRITACRAQQRTYRLAIWRQCFEPAHQDIKQTLACGLFGHVAEI